MTLAMCCEKSAERWVIEASPLEGLVERCTLARFETAVRPVQGQGCRHTGMILESES
jgi:hypothetical protein